MRALSALAAAVVLSWLAPPPAPASAATIEGGARETAFHYTVELDGVVATVTERITLTADADTVAVYTFALPAEAAVVGLAVTPPGGKAQRGVAVDATGAITPAADADVVIAPDLGLVRRLGDVDDRAVAYELRVWPVGPAGDTVAEVTWVAPLEVDDGRLALRVPGRGDGDGALTTARGTVKVIPPHGVKAMRDLHAGGDLLAASPGKKAWAFTAPQRGELRIDVRPALGDDPLVVWTAAPVGDAGGAIAVAALRPREAAPASAIERAVIVVDVSAMTAADADDRGELVERVVEGLPSARFAVVGYDRRAHRLTGGFARTTDEAAVRDAGDAVRGASPRAGGDLRGALALAAELLDADGAPARERADLVVVVTDGVLPTDATAGALDAALGGGATVSAALLVDDAGGLPAVDSALRELVAARAGHVVVLRRGELLTRGARLAGELAAPPTWSMTGVDAGAADVRLDLPPALPAGGGAIAFGWYAGEAPTKLRVETSAGALVAKKAKLRHAAALATRHASFYAPGVHGEGTEAADRHVARLERRVSLVGAWTSLVAVDGRDELAAARAALAARGGTFARIAPPGEGELRVDDGVVDEVAEALRAGPRARQDPAERIRTDLLTSQLLPAARRCQQAQLRAGGSRQGQIRLEIEIARAEVIAVRATSTAGAKKMTDCVSEAAYELKIASYTLEDPEAIHLIRYPLRFAPGRSSRDADGDAAADGGADADADVTLDDDDGGPARVAPPTDVEDPLGGLRERDR